MTCDIVCADIGGSKMRLARIRDHRDIIDRCETATPTRDLSGFLAAFLELCQKSGSKNLPLHIALAGLQDPENGKCRAANIPCLNGVDLAGILADRLNTPVRIANDADCFTLAETRAGAALGHANVFGAILGTGVGGGIVIGHQLVSGLQGLVGEWGHGPFIRASDSAYPCLSCGCGQRGCLDTIAGARGIERLHGWRYDLTLPAPEIIRRWIANDPSAKDTITKHIAIVSDALALIVNMTGASCIPLGGGLANVAPLVTALDQALRGKILRHSALPIIVKAKLGNDAGLIGASYL